MSIFASVGRFVHKHTPAILTAGGVAGVISTAVLAARSHADAREYLYQNALMTDDWMVQVKRTWRFYIPPVLSGGVTIVCVISAQVVNSRRQAVLMGLIAIGQETLQEYREATREVVGPKKDQEIYDKIAEKQVQTNQAPSIAILESGDILCEDSFTKQKFGSSVEKIRKAANDVMEQVLYGDGWASQNDFARAAGISPTDFGEEVGYNPNNKLEIVFSTSLTKEDIPVLVINYLNAPKVNFDGVW